MYRFYAELFVLVLLAFTVGAIVAAAVLRIVLRQKADPTPVSAEPAGDSAQPSGGKP